MTTNLAIYPMRVLVRVWSSHHPEWDAYAFVPMLAVQGRDSDGRWILTSGVVSELEMVAMEQELCQVPGPCPCLLDPLSWEVVTDEDVA